MWTKSQQKALKLFYKNEDFSKLKQPKGKMSLGCLIVLGAVIAICVYGVAVLLLNLYSFKGSY